MDMNCQKCRYDLRQAASGRCPECGLAFDPLLSETFHTPRQGRLSLPWRWIVCFAVLFGIGLTYDQVVNASFFQPCSTPKSASAVSRLQTARSQIQLYANHHNNTYPTLEQLNINWGVLTHETNVEGQSAQPGEVTYGPYLQCPPVNDLNGSNTVAPPGQSTASDGWEYDQTTGMLWLVAPTREVYDELGADPHVAVIASRP